MRECASFTQDRVPVQRGHGQHGDRHQERPLRHAHRPGQDGGRHRGRALLCRPRQGW